jgi:hypothetical protein
VARAALVALAVVLLGVLAGCSSGSSDAASEAPPVTDPLPPVVYVALGGIETLNSDRRDLPDNWTQLLFSEHMAPGGVYVNLATEDGTVKSALDGQLPQALDVHATVATVWLENTDLRLGTSLRVYRDELTTLVEDLQAGGAKVYLLRSGPSAPDDVAAPLQATVAVVAGQTGAMLIDLGDISDRNDDSGQRRIADEVAAAIGTDLGH